MKKFIPQLTIGNATFLNIRVETNDENELVKVRIPDVVKMGDRISQIQKKGPTPLVPTSLINEHLVNLVCNQDTQK